MKRNVEFGQSIEAFSQFKIAREDVESTWQYPEESTAFNSHNLYLKEFTPERSLLVALHCVDDIPKFVFSFWIPNELKKPDLVLTLSQFLMRFGTKVKIGEDTDYLILNSAKYFKPIETPDIDLDCPNIFKRFHTKIYNVDRAESINGQVLCHFDLAFAVNNGQYLFWLTNEPYKAIEVPSGLHSVVENIVKYLQPQVKLKVNLILKRRPKTVPLPVQTKKSLEVPEKYSKRFTEMARELSEVRVDEQVIFNLQLPTSNKYCIFCGRDDVNREHILPKWFNKLYPAVPLTKTHVVSEPGNLSFLSERKAENSDGLIAEVVCKSCNSGWMSQIEDPVRNILFDANGNLVLSLSEIDRFNAERLSLWLVLKSVIAISDLIKNFDADVLSTLKEGIIPNGFLVELCEIDHKGIAIAESINTKDRLRNAKSETIDPNTFFQEFFSIVLVIDNLMFRVSYLNPSYPYHFTNTLIRTKKLHPFDVDIPYLEINIPQADWSANVEIAMHLNSLLIEPSKD
jgi:hypothetical protein